MGKSTVALWLQELGVPVLDSDQARSRWGRGQEHHEWPACTGRGLHRRHSRPLLSLLPTLPPQVVHQLYSSGGAAVAPVDAAFPGVAVDGGACRGC